MLHVGSHCVNVALHRRTHSLVVVHRLSCSCCGILVPWTRISPHPLHGKVGFLITRPPGKSSHIYILHRPVECLSHTASHRELRLVEDLPY